MKTILFYGLTENKYSVYKSFAEKNKVKVLYIKDTSVSLDNALNHENDEYDGKEDKPGYMIFSEFSKDDMFNFTQLLKKEHLEFTGIKLMLTGVNRAWRIEDLLERVKEEHESFMNADYLYYLVNRAKNIDHDDILENLIRESSDEIKDPNRDNETLKRMIRDMEAELRKYYKKSEGKA